MEVVELVSVDALAELVLLCIVIYLVQIGGAVNCGVVASSSIPCLGDRCL